MTVPEIIAALRDHFPEAKIKITITPHSLCGVCGEFHAGGECDADEDGSF